MTNADDLALARRKLLEPSAVRSMTVRANADSGAFMLCLNEQVATQLELAVLDKQSAQMADDGVRELEVQGPMASMRFKGSVDPKQVGEQLRVDHLLQGKVSRTGDRLRINVSLQKASDGFGLWGTNYDRRLTDIFAIRTEVAQQVAEALKLTLGVEEKRALGRSGTDNAEAYARCLQGRASWNRRSFGELEKAIRFFHQALQLDTNYALAYAGLADIHTILPIYETEHIQTPGDHPQFAAQFATKALHLDPTLAEPHAALGYVRGLYHWDWDGAEKEFQAGILLNPKSANTYHWYADTLMSMGRFEEALHMAEISINLDPSPVNHATYAEALISMGRIDAAIAYLHKRLELEPWFGLYHLNLSRAYVRNREYVRFAEATERAYLALGWETDSLALLTSWARAKQSGKTEEVRSILPGVVRLRAFRLTTVMEVLGEENELALDVLEHRIERRGVLDFSVMAFIHNMEQLRNHPRYQAILRKLNFKK